MTQPISFGDLVCIDGDGNRVFQVESFREETHYWQDGIMSELVYELFDCGNADWLEADAEDLTLVADASQADEYLRANPGRMEPSSIDFTNYLGGDLTMFNFGNDDAKKPTPKPTARELSGQEADRIKKERKLRKENRRMPRPDDLLSRTGRSTAEAKVAEIKQELAESVAEGAGR